MLSMKKNTFSFVGLFLLVPLLLGCQGCNNNNSAEKGAAKFKVAMVLPGNITDKSWNQAGHEGLTLIGKEVADEVTFSEKVSQPDQAEALSDYARRGYSVVIGHGGEFQGAAERVAPRFPNTTFIVNNGTKPMDNVSTVGFKYKQMGYLIGFLCGRTTKSKTVGFIGAQKIKSYIELSEGFERGFKDACPDGKVLIAWTNDWDDIAKGKEAAINQINQGADIVFPTMDNAVVGSLQAAKENGVFGVGIYYDAISDWPDVVIQSAILNIRSAMKDTVVEIKSGDKQGKAYEYGFESPDSMRLGTFHSSISQDIQKEVLQKQEELKSGKIDL